ncbi:putative response regulatory protein [compost metagenome]
MTEHDLRNPTILLAEDEPDLRMTLRDFLVMKGYEVLVARDGLEALELSQRHPVDVVLTDLKMPKLDGLALLKALKERDARIEVIFLTGQATLTDAIEALREGRSFDFLLKPIGDLKRLERVIQRAYAQGMERRKAEEPGPPSERAALIAEILKPVSEAIADHPKLQEALRFIAARFHTPIGLAEVASAIGYSPSYLTHVMRRKTEMTVQRWIAEFRLAEAQRLLASTDWPLQQICEAVGYGSLPHFHRLFRERFGLPPQEWRERR